METPDGYWRVEAWSRRHGRERFYWYRIIHAKTVVADRAAIATVQHILGDAYVELVPVDPAA